MLYALHCSHAFVAGQAHLAGHLITLLHDIQRYQSCISCTSRKSPASTHAVLTSDGVTQAYHSNQLAPHQFL